MLSINKTARMAGFWYLIFIVATTFATILRSKLITSDAAATARNILASAGLFRVAFITDLLSAVFFFLAAWSLYVLLKPVDQDLALLFLALNLGGVVIQCMNAFSFFAALLFLNGTVTLNAFQPAQLQALAMECLNFYKVGFMVAQVFFSTWLFPLGYLVYKSRFLPRILGILLMIDCFGVLVWFLQFFLFPAYGVISYPFLAESFVAEVGLTLWLLIKGVNIEQWKKPTLGSS